MKQKLKNAILYTMIVSSFGMMIWGCTSNTRAKTFGGSTTVNLPAGQKLVNATWKESDLWYLTEPMDSTYVPQLKIFKEQSSFGVWEGTVKFQESK